MALNELFLRSYLVGFGLAVATCNHGGKPPYLASISQSAAEAPAQDPRSVDSLQRDLNELREHTIDIRQLPPSVFRGKSANETMEMIRSLVTEDEDSASTVDSCTARIDDAIENQNLVFKTMEKSTQHSIEYQGSIRAIQVCMKSIRRYEGELDGQSRSLVNAVVAYQHSKHLKTDGAIGKMTWQEIKLDLRAAQSPTGQNPDH